MRRAQNTVAIKAFFFPDSLMVNGIKILHNRKKVHGLCVNMLQGKHPSFFFFLYQPDYDPIYPGRRLYMCWVMFASALFIKSHNPIGVRYCVLIARPKLVLRQRAHSLAAEGFCPFVRWRRRTWNLNAVRHHRVRRFIMLSRHGRIMNDECQQRGKQNKQVWFFFWDCSMTLYPSLSLFLPSPALPSVVVLYTQGVESKQWREVRDHRHFSVSTAQSAHDSPFRLCNPAPPSLPPTSPALLSLKVKDVGVNHLQLIDPANISASGRCCVICDWLAD